MPSFTNQLANLRTEGPLCQVRIGVSDPVAEELQKENKPVPNPVEVTAIIDTGASGTVINPSIVENLGLVVRGTIDISTPSTKTHPCNLYDISLLFPNRVRISLIPVIEAPLEGQNIQCLIGRDVLAMGVFIYVGYNNTFTLSF